MDLQVYAIEQSSIFYARKRKLHIYDWDSDKCLCGCQTLGTCTLQDANKEWLTQPDPEETICKRCKEIALKLLDKEDQV